MNKNNILSIILCIVLILSLSFKSLAYKVYTQEENSSDKVFFQNYYNYPYKNIDVFNNIIKAVNGKTIEYGITAQFISSCSEEKIVNKLFNKLCRYGQFNEIKLNKGESYSIEFKGNSMIGYIESVRYKDHNIIKINVVKQDTRYNMAGLKKQFDFILKDIPTKIRYFQYIKVKIENNNIDDTYRKIKTTLKNIGDTDIKTETLENGYTSTTYTGQYESIYSDGDPIDFNFAVVRYSTGTYIIMGTPEIIETY